MTLFSETVYRFAPSPTGFLHVGGARTAIFNWLLARQNSAKFLLRIEDTDRERSTAESVLQIKSSLTWLGLDWDGEPVLQSARLDRHREIAQLLLQRDEAYRCFCPRDELLRKRQIAEAEKSSYLYDGTCRELTKNQIRRNLNDGKSYTIRLRIPPGITTFSDDIHGKIDARNNEIDDFVILRADATPVYQLAVVVDDHDLNVTHVVRGDDHLTNTPKQILIMNALGWTVPRFAHLPLILGPDRNRLSKRHGAASVEEFREQGILADALFNYLCLLGWAPGEDQEIFTREQLVNIFSVERINKSNAVFDHRKLLWMNGQYLNRSSAESLLKYASQSLRTKIENINGERLNALYGMTDLVKQRARTLDDLEQGLDFFIHAPQEYDSAGVDKFFTQSARDQLHKCRRVLDHTEDFSPEHLENLIRNLAEDLNLNAAEIIHPLRLALTGSTNSPGIFDIIHLLGKGDVLKRLDRALDFIANKHTG